MDPYIEYFLNYPFHAHYTSTSVERKEWCEMTFGKLELNDSCPWFHRKYAPTYERTMTGYVSIPEQETFYFKREEDYSLFCIRFTK